MLNVIGNRYVRNVFTLSKRTSVDALYTTAYYYGFKTSAIVERMIANARNTLGNYYCYYFMESTERIVANTLYIVRYNAYVTSGNQSFSFLFN